MRKFWRKIYLIAIVAIIIVLGGCATTSKIPAGEQLYNGMQLKLHAPEGENLPSGMLEDLTNSVNVRPNNPWPLVSPYRRDPWPLGLWIYNNMSDSAVGIKKWIYDKLATPPVLVKDVRANLRVKMLEQILSNNGYFGSKVAYSVEAGRNPKKGTIRYDVLVAKPYMIDSLEYISDSTLLGSYIDSIAKMSKYLVAGQRFCVDSLSAERVRIANSLRNRGFYYFKPDYIEFMADSLIKSGSVVLRLQLVSNLPKDARRQYITGAVNAFVFESQGRGAASPDTISTTRGNVYLFPPAKIRRNLIPSCLSFRKGRIFSIRDMNRTQSRLARLGIFNNIQILPVVRDTNSINPKMDVVVTCQLGEPIEASVEANVTSKSNSYLGPGVIIGITNNNAFNGGEKLSLEINANYEWQTGRNRSSLLNSYEFGLTSSISFPRLLAPNFVKRNRRDLSWTQLTLGADLMNRPHFFKMAEFHTGITYEWHSNNVTYNKFTPFKLSYNKLMNRTVAFDSVMQANPAIALSFESQFIPQMNYTYALEKFCEDSKINGINLNVSLTEAGNVFDGVYSLLGVKGEKRLFETPFSQFIKGQAQFVYSRRLIPHLEHWLVSRILIGAAHAYGNSSQVPYSEQFYIGGANSIRAFTVRSIGPGSYTVPKSMKNGYFDQTGTFKFELNTEYRFPIAGILHGAVFLDSGNIWLLKADPLRPGGQLKGNTFLRDMALGTGAGLRIDLGMIVVRGDLGYGLHAPYSTGIDRYFNIALKNAFAFHLAIGYPF